METWMSKLLVFAIWLMIAVVVIWLSQKLLDEWMRHKTRLSAQQMNMEKANRSFQQKIQAYERLILLLDRISIPSLIIRLQEPGATTEMLSNSMIIAIQQEFEHNVTQQLYVKDNLWNIIVLIKDELSASISLVADEHPGLDAGDFIRSIMEYHQKKGQLLIAKGQSAVKEEAGLLLHHN
jgi:hypothetical protein